MYIEITVYSGEDEFSPIYEKATATNMNDAEAEIARIGRRYAKEVLDGSKGQEETNDE